MTTITITVPKEYILINYLLYQMTIGLLCLYFNPMIDAVNPSEIGSDLRQEVTWDLWLSNHKTAIQYH